MAGPIAALNHGHPKVPVFNQRLGEGLAGRVFGAVNPGGAMMLQEILEGIPSQFVSELEGLNETLLFEVGESPLMGEGASSRKLGKGFFEILETLPPADVFVWILRSPG